MGGWGMMVYGYVTKNYKINDEKGVGDCDVVNCCCLVCRPDI